MSTDFYQIFSLYLSRGQGRGGGRRKRVGRREGEDEERHTGHIFHKGIDSAILTVSCA